jgi:hypothetical protein
MVTAQVRRVFETITAAALGEALGDLRIRMIVDDAWCKQGFALVPARRTQQSTGGSALSRPAPESEQRSRRRRAR